MTIVYGVWRSYEHMESKLIWICASKDRAEQLIKDYAILSHNYYIVDEEVI